MKRLMVVVAVALASVMAIAAQCSRKPEEGKRYCAQHGEK